ncbi:MAG: choice-of-anchor D domain-containing protein [Verrucomicrobia bacterium]|nr:choice-of-anchor D domain-containing protein [Verrucomicrobiota bacterium]
MKNRACLFTTACAISLSFSLTPPGRAADVVATWAGAASATWADDVNWTCVPGPNVFPNNGGSTYNAVINASGGPYTVSLATDIVIQKLTLNSADATLELQSGNLTALTGVTLANGVLRMNGGTLLNTTVTPTGGSVVFSGSSGNILNGATLGGDLVLNQAGDYHSLRLQNGASFTGNAQLGTPDGYGVVLGYEQTGTLYAKTLNFDPAFGNAYLSIDGDHTLTFGSSLVARGSAVIGQAYFVGGTSTLVNQGRISADLVGQTLTINPSVFTNQGIAETINGATLTLNASTAWSNATGGTIRATGAGSILNFYGNYTNAGSIVLADSTLNLHGTFNTAALGLTGFSRSGTSVVNIAGDLDNTGGTLALTAATGDWTMAGGRIIGGTITQAGGARLLFSGNGGSRLDDATFSGDLLLNQAGDAHYLRLQNGASFTGNAYVGTPDGYQVILSYEQTGSLNAKTLNFDPLFGNAYLSIDGDNTLTFGPSLVARGTAIIGQAVFVAGTSTLINKGRIAADLAGQTLTISPAVFTNQGIAEAINGATLAIQATDWSNAAGGTLRATGTGSILNVYGNYTNVGNIVLADSTLNLYGTFTTAALGVGGFSRSGASVVNIVGDLDNTGGTFALTAATGDWTLAGGRIIGGTITQAGGAKLLFPGYGSNRLDGATFNGDLLLNQAGDAHYLRLQNGASFTGNAQLGTPDGSSVILGYEQTGTLNAKTLNFDPASGNAYLTIEGGNTLTFGPTLVARGTAVIGQAYFVGGTSTLVNQGRISADLAGQTLTINPAVFTNQGLVEAVNGASLTLQATDLTNLPDATLTGGSWKSFAGSSLWFYYEGFTTNAADLTLDGAGSVMWVTPSQTPLEDVLTSNAGGGALRILGGRNYPTNAFTNAGTLQLGGGTFTPTALTNSASGQLFGFGTVAVRPTNSGTIRSVGGTLAFTNGIQGGSGTVQVDSGSTLNLSAGAASGSSADFLLQNGNLVLGTKTFAVGVDYTNANFGTGNSFAPRTNVSGSGGIQAVGGTGQTLSGNVSAGATATPNLAFGKVHVGTAPTLSYQINNTGASGSRLRGAIQTSVNGGNLTDSRLSGAGVTAGNFGAILPGGNSGSLPVTFTVSSAGPLTGQTVRLLNNFDNVADQTLSITGTAYRYAVPSAHTPAPVAFGNFHVGATPPSQLLTISNLAANDTFSEALNASIGGATGGVTTNGGSFTALSPGTSNGSSLAVGIGTGSAGSKNGTATISLTSNGIGSSELGLTPLAAQTVTVTGSVYRLAQAALPGGTNLNLGIFHAGDLAQVTVSVTNTATTDGFSEALDGSFSGNTGALTGSGSFTALAPGAASGATKVTLDTTTVGVKSGTATLALVSNGVGSSGLANTPLLSQVIAATGQVNRYAAPLVTKDSGTATLSGSGNAYTVTFGRRTLGENPPAVTLRLTNSAAAPADTLAGSFAAAAPDFTFSGFGSFSNLGAGQSQQHLIVALQTDSPGTFSQTITLNGFSQNTSGYNGALSPLTITLTGEVAAAPTLKIQVAGANAVLSWPLAEQDWVLKKGNDLVGWSVVTEPVVNTPTEHTVTTPRGGAPKLFFRLEK